MSVENQLPGTLTNPNSAPEQDPESTVEFAAPPISDTTSEHDYVGGDEQKERQESPETAPQRSRRRRRTIVGGLTGGVAVLAVSLAAYAANTGEDESPSNIDQSIEEPEPETDNNVVPDPVVEEPTPVEPEEPPVVEEEPEIVAPEVSPFPELEAITDIFEYDSQTDAATRLAYTKYLSDKVGITTGNIDLEARDLTDDAGAGQEILDAHFANIEEHLPQVYQALGPVEAQKWLSGLYKHGPYDEPGQGINLRYENMSSLTGDGVFSEPNASNGIENPKVVGITDIGAEVYISATNTVDGVESTAYYYFARQGYHEPNKDAEEGYHDALQFTDSY
ncbi:MAG TPA: hypothetical protein VFT59_02360 [Candidatus Saccharimonadales bacterium]|nr:hypothetical protein [Candidatus Saccharimonadales bacterium]